MKNVAKTDSVMITADGGEELNFPPRQSISKNVGNSFQERGI